VLLFYCKHKIALYFIRKTYFHFSSIIVQPYTFLNIRNFFKVGLRVKTIMSLCDCKFDSSVKG